MYVNVALRTGACLATTIYLPNVYAVSVHTTSMCQHWGQLQHPWQQSPQHITLQCWMSCLIATIHLLQTHTAFQIFCSSITIKCVQYSYDCSSCICTQYSTNHTLYIVHNAAHIQHIKYDMFCNLFAYWIWPFWGRNVLLSEAVMSYAQEPTNTYI